MTPPEFRPSAQVLAEVVRTAKVRKSRRRRRRRVLLTVAAALLVVVAVAGALTLTRGGDDRVGVTTGPGPIGPQTTLTRPPLTAAESWRPMAKSPLTARAEPVTAWTGKVLLLWRGMGSSTDTCGSRSGVLVCGDPTRSDGAAYDPATDRWRPMADSPLPKEPGSAMTYASAWTGRELLVWGGPGPRGAAYDPQSDSWRKISPGPLQERDYFVSSVWTGSELIIWGGRARRQADLGLQIHEKSFRDGAAYDPTTDTWRRIPAAPHVTASRSQAIWDGRDMLVFSSRGGRGGARQIAMAFDPRTWRWRDLASPPFVHFSATPVWTGEVIVAAGGAPRLRGADRSTALPPVAATYDPATDQWSLLPQPPPSAGVGLDGRSLWTGQEVLFIGTDYNREVPRDTSVVGAALDPITRTWRPLSPSRLEGRTSPATAWTGSELLLWGGWAPGGDPFADGARYLPGPGR